MTSIKWPLVLDRICRRKQGWYSIIGINLPITESEPFFCCLVTPAKNERTLRSRFRLVHIVDFIYPQSRRSNSLSRSTWSVSRRDVAAVL